VEADNNKFIFGCMKIAYEIIMNLFPQNHNDSVLNWIKQSISTMIFHRRYKKIQDKSNLELMKRYDSIFKSIKGLDTTHHAVVIENIKGIGLVCCVRIFNWFYPVIISLNSKLIKEGESIIIYNDALKRTYSSNVFYKNVNIKLTIDLKNLSEETKGLINKENGTLFYNSEEQLSIYNHKKQIMYKTPDNLCDDKIKELNSYNVWLNENYDLNLENDNLFLKTIEGLNVKLLAITFDREIILQKFS
jgi:hypothetical protein